MRYRGQSICQGVESARAGEGHRLRFRGRFRARSSPFSIIDFCRAFFEFLASLSKRAARDVGHLERAIRSILGRFAQVVVKPFASSGSAVRCSLTSFIPSVILSDGLLLLDFLRDSVGRSVQVCGVGQARLTFSFSAISAGFRKLARVRAL